MTAGCRRIRERINVRLYAWQKECIRAWRDNDFHGIVNVVTGAGKTIMALYGARLLEKHLQSVSPAASLRVKVHICAGRPVGGRHEDVSSGLRRVPSAARFSPQ